MLANPVTDTPSVKPRMEPDSTTQLRRRVVTDDDPLREENAKLVARDAKLVARIERLQEIVAHLNREKSGLRIKLTRAKAENVRLCTAMEIRAQQADRDARVRSMLCDCASRNP